MTETSEGKMAHETDLPPRITSLDGKFCNNGNVSSMEGQNDETSDLSIQSNAGKPPRGFTAMRHSCSSAWLAESEQDKGILSLKPPSADDSEFLPVYRSGSSSEKGPKPYMEDERGGIGGASFTKKNILKYIVTHFPASTKKAVRSAFVRADHAIADAKSLDKSSSTTVLTALMLGRTMLIANFGDSQAVLGKCRRAIKLSKDHEFEELFDRRRRVFDSGM